MTQAMAFEALKADVGRQRRRPGRWGSRAQTTGCRRTSSTSAREAGASAEKNAETVGRVTGRQELRGHDRPGFATLGGGRDGRGGPAMCVAHKGGQWSDHFERAAGAYNPATRDGIRRPRGCGEAAGHRVPAAAGQRRQISAQQGPHGPAHQGSGGCGGFPSTNKCGEELQPTLQQRAEAAGRAPRAGRPC